ncbi:hypothetical protein [Klebsiella phage ST13-OXA48phi12.3]|nr:hypothetical protein [Klebsiella phage ST13-OXA48phi12.3]
MSSQKRFYSVWKGVPEWSGRLVSVWEWSGIDKEKPAFVYVYN